MQEVHRSTEIEHSMLVLAVSAAGNFNLFHSYHKSEKQASCFGQEEVLKGFSWIPGKASGKESLASVEQGSGETRAVFCDLTIPYEFLCPGQPLTPFVISSVL